MSKLIITDAEGKKRDFPLTKERVTIGRHNDNDIPLLNDKASSGHHAVVITILQDSFLEDLDSTNGTLVNGKQVAKHPLTNGDVIAIGRHTLKFEGEAKGAEDEFEKTMIIKPGQMGAAFNTAATAAAAAPAAASAPAAGGGPIAPVLGKLKVNSGPSTGKELELTKALTTLGRPGVQVAAITRRADGYYIVHVGGAGGGTKRPIVNGAEIDVQARKLANNDVIELAGTQMTFLIVG
ncbi:MAG: FHA domain-containing protein [Pseudomonadota bacterium]|mgnify:CR=1 FL=1